MLPDGDLWFTGNDNAHKRRDNAKLKHPRQHSWREDFHTHGFGRGRTDYGNPAPGQQDLHAITVLSSLCLFSKIFSSLI
jgi:hypothetical protein